MAKPCQANTIVRIRCQKCRRVFGVAWRLVSICTCPNCGSGQAWAGGHQDNKQSRRAPGILRTESTDSSIGRRAAANCRGGS